VDVASDATPPLAIRPDGPYFFTFKHRLLRNSSRLN
jgi:hypothetical protein